MSEERLERMEGMIEQLIKLVAESHRKADESVRKADESIEKADESMGIAQESLNLSKETLIFLKKMEEKNEQRHKEVIKEFRNQSGEIDYLREMVSKHDMEIHKLKASN
ncbi:hypothetical protein RZN22_12895 [Bacillaceae bacterium S4-13-58]